MLVWFLCEFMNYIYSPQKHFEDANNHQKFIKLLVNLTHDIIAIVEFSRVSVLR